MSDERIYYMIQKARIEGWTTDLVLDHGTEVMSYVDSLRAQLAAAQAELERLREVLARRPSLEAEALRGGMTAHAQTEFSGHEEVTRLREVVAWYGDEANWKEHYRNGRLAQMSFAAVDKGQRARDALRKDQR